MNNKRRNEINKTIIDLQKIKNNLSKYKDDIKMLIEEVNNINMDIEFIRDDEINAYENMPESLQCSERGEKMEMNIEALEDAYDCIYLSHETSIIDIKNNINDGIKFLKQAMKK